MLEIACFLKSRKHYNGNFCEPLIATQKTEQLEAGHVGEVQIEQHQGRQRVHAGKVADGVPGLVDYVDGVSYCSPFKGQLQLLDVRSAVISHQYAQGRQAQEFSNFDGILVMG